MRAYIDTNIALDAFFFTVIYDGLPIFREINSTHFTMDGAKQATGAGFLVD